MLAKRSVVVQTFRWCQQTGDCCSNRLRVFRNAQAFSRWPWRMSSAVDASGVVRTIPGTPWLRG